MDTPATQIPEAGDIVQLRLGDIDGKGAWLSTVLEQNPQVEVRSERREALEHVGGIEPDCKHDVLHR